MQRVEFKPGSKLAELVVPMPKPSVNYVPEWFKNIPGIDNHGKNTSKKCMPFMDSFITGYTQELWCDVEILKINGSFKYSFGGDVAPMSSRFEYAGSENLFPHFQGYEHVDFHWITQWEPKTPKGYSTFYSHPYNHFDLPFTTMSGFIDTDSYWGNGPLPFLIKDNFEGIIPAGTPIYQINFIKRDSWISSKGSFDENEYAKMRHSIKKYLSNGYKKTYWNKKSFN